MIQIGRNKFERASMISYVISAVMFIIMLVARMPELLLSSIVIAVIGKMLDDASELMIEKNKTYNRRS